MYTQLVDDYIQIDTQIKTLEAQLKVMREAAIAANAPELTGPSGRKLKVITSFRNTTDWKMLAAEQQIPQDVITSFTKTTPVTTLKIA